MIKLKRLIQEIKIERIPQNFTDKAGYKIEDDLTGDEFRVEKYYSDGDVLRYILSQHPDFEEHDKVDGIFQCMELNPKDLDPSEFHVDDDKVKELSKSTRPYPPIVLNQFGWIIDGGHRLDAAKIRGDKRIKVLKQMP
jgi:hypothetical protein